MRDDGHYGDPPQRDDPRHLRRAIKVIVVSTLAGLAAIVAVILGGWR
jgi:hypothetical protein